MSMCFVSNQEFSEGEFTDWIESLKKIKQREPTIPEIRKKLEELKIALNKSNKQNQPTQNRQNFIKQIRDTLADKSNKGVNMNFFKVSLEYLEDEKAKLENEIAELHS